MKLLKILMLCTILAGCAGGPSVRNHSDIAQFGDIASTFVAIEAVGGSVEANPIIAPLLGHPAGYVVVLATKWGVNYGFRKAEPRTCIVGIRAMTSTGFALLANNIGQAVSLSNPITLGIGVAVGLFNWFRNDNFIRECKLEEKYPEFDIYEGWRQGKLFGEGVRRGD